MDETQQPSKGPLPRLASTEELIAHGGQDSPGSVRAQLANAMVGMKKQFYGKGPTGAKAWVLDEYVFVAMEGGLTRNEETLLAAGEHQVVREYREHFQNAMTDTTVAAVEEILGRKVASYHSQIVFEPPRAFEIFVLAPEE